MARLFHFVAGTSGAWRVTSLVPIVGETLAAAPRLAVVADSAAAAEVWSLRGIVSNERYVTSEERARLVGKQEGLGRAQATRASLIPIRKSAAWWALTQQERRAVFEERSSHIAIGLDYLPAVARRLHHCRDLGEDEPFDFLTWFEYAPEHQAEFEELLGRLRETEEWRYVEREVQVELERAAP